MIHKSNAVFLAYLGVLSIVGIGVAYAATSRMGPGVSTDSAMILSTAENLLRGRGLVDYTGTELTQFPPLYSLILAAGSFAFREDVFVVGWLLNLLVFGALVWFTGIYLHQAFPGEPLWAYLGSFIVLSSTSLLEISANIASDPLFLLMVLFFLMNGAIYLQTGRARYAAVAGSLAVIACFQRYAALALVITGALLVAYANRRRPARAVLGMLIFGLVTAAPIVAWGFLHNEPVNGTVFGGRLPAVPSLNFARGAEKVLYWFIPYRLIEAAGAPVLFFSIVLVCVLAIVATGGKRFLRRATEPHVVPNILFLFVYFAVLVFDISYYELKGIKTDRVHIIALPSLLAILSAFGSQMLDALRRRIGSQAVFGMAVMLFVLWTAYPISKSNEYVRHSMIRGDVSSYNSINKGNVQTSALADYLHGLDLTGKTVYSNGCDTVWFILRSIVVPVPRLGSTNRIGELGQQYAGWPGPGTQGYVVWVNAEAHKTNYATPDELSFLARMTEIYRDQDATVYLVKSY